MLRKFIAGVTILPLLLTVLVFTGCEKKSEPPTAGEAIRQETSGRPGPAAARRRMEKLREETGAAEETP